MSVFDPFIQAFGLDTRPTPGNDRPYIVISYERAKCTASLCATFTDKDGKPGILRMPDAIRFFSVEIAQVMLTKEQANAEKLRRTCLRAIDLS